MNPFSRRKLLAQSGLIAFSLAAQDAKEPSPRKLKVIVSGGHPGDPEYGCGGAVARYTASGHDVVLLYLNRGEPNHEVRTSEAQKACQILKARAVFAGQIDGQAVVDAAHYEAFEKIIAVENPDVVFTQWPIDNHRDHRATSTLVYDAWLKLDRKFELYYYEVSDGEDTLMFSPTVYIDITAVAARKKAACYAHASQTPDKFYPLQDQVARFRGLEGGFQQSEAFIRHAQSKGNLLPGQYGMLSS